MRLGTFFALGCLAPILSFAQVQQRDLERQGVKPLTNGELVEIITGNTLRHVNLVNAIELDMLYRLDGVRIYWTGGAGDWS